MQKENKKSKITTDSQEHIIVMVTAITMLQNKEPRKKVIKMIEDFIYNT